MSNYHAHVYFAPAQEPRARSLLVALSRAPLRFERLHSRPVGPHPLPMIELHFDGRDLREALRRLEILRDGFSVLVHEDTGDDLRDHTRGALWLGARLPLDFSFFARVRENPSLALHPPRGRPD